MSILVDKNTRMIVQGITGKEGSFHTRLCKEYGTKIVAGIVPCKGGSFFEDIPVYNTIQEALKKESFNTSMIFVPARFAFNALKEAIDAKLDLIVCITEGIPIHDMMKVKQYLRNKKTRLIGPNCPGIISPKSKTKVGIMPVNIFVPGNISVMSRSGTLTYEIVAQISKNGFGQSTCVGIGGDPIVGMHFIDYLKLFERDPETEAVVMIGEIGGNAEEEAAKWISTNFTKPVVAYICGLSAPPEKRMGHAGAIISGGKGNAEEKIETLQKAGVEIAKSLDEISEKLIKILNLKRV